MNLDTIQPRWVVALGLLALLPVLWYSVERSGSGGAFAAINVVVIFATIYVAMRPVAHGNGDHDHEDAEASA